MPRRKRMTAAQMLLSGGYLNFRRAVRHAARYGAACSVEGHLLTLDEYWALTGLSRSQAFREQAAWRACCGSLSVLEVVSESALAEKGFTEQEREEVIVRQLAGG
jgi:hypothetical protein